VSRPIRSDLYFRSCIIMNFQRIFFSLFSLFLPQFLVKDQTEKSFVKNLNFKIVIFLWKTFDIFLYLYLGDFHVGYSWRFFTFMIVSVFFDFWNFRWIFWLNDFWLKFQFLTKSLTFVFFLTKHFVFLPNILTFRPNLAKTWILEKKPELFFNFLTFCDHVLTYEKKHFDLIVGHVVKLFCVCYFPQAKKRGRTKSQIIIIFIKSCRFLKFVNPP